MQLLLMQAMLVTQLELDHQVEEYMLILVAHMQDPQLVIMQLLQQLTQLFIHKVYFYLMYSCQCSNNSTVS